MTLEQSRLKLALQEGHFIWEESGLPLTYNNWRAVSKEPNGQRGENCGEIYNSANDYEWNDAACTNTNRKSICQIMQ